MSRFLLLPLLVLVGCGDAKPPTYPVTGKVVYKKSATVIPAGALVVFHPADMAEEARLGGKPYGNVKADGTFTLSTYGEGDGAPDGEYGVTVQWTKEGKAAKLAIGDGSGATTVSMLNPKYGNPQQPFTKVMVKKGEKNEFTFDVD